MIEWQDDGIVLRAHPHGETAMVVNLLTREHGRHAGLVQGGQSPRRQTLLQAGQQVSAHWRARLSDQLGHYALEANAPFPALVLDDGDALAGLSAACAVADAALPEREAHPAVFEGLCALIDILGTPAWPYAYVRWELGLLSELGYGLNLSACAVTGQTEGLTHVSPRSARAVSADIAQPYLDKLLPLPPFLLGRGEVTATCLADGLRLTGFFLERAAFAVHHLPLPQARLRLADRFETILMA